jgi:hypothetical protein
VSSEPDQSPVLRGRSRSEGHKTLGCARQSQALSPSIKQAHGVAASVLGATSPPNRDEASLTWATRGPQGQAATSAGLHTDGKAVLIMARVFVIDQEKRPAHLTQCIRERRAGCSR